jgi:hypothetical protein
MNISDKEDLLIFINRLLERLHQADLKNFGSHINLVYVASGAQYINKIDTQVLSLQNPKESVYDSPTPDTLPILPEALATSEAMALWEKLQQAGYIDENYQPLISRTQAAILAYEMARRLGIKEKWKVFEALWNRKGMYHDYYLALNQQQSLAFRDELRRLF